MKILRVIGLGMLIVMLQFLVPRIFAGIENTLLAFFDTLETILGSAQDISQAGVNVPLSR